MSAILESLWLLRVRRMVRPYRPVWRRHQAALAAQYDAFLDGRGQALQAEFATMPTGRTALVVGYDTATLAIFQAPILFGLRSAGYRVIVLAPSSIGASADFYRKIGAADVVGTEDVEAQRRPKRAELEPVCRNQQELLNLSYDGVSIGRFVVSTLMRRLRKGSIDPGRADVAPLLAAAVAGSARAVDNARAIVSRYRPDLVCFFDRGYTPDGELFEVALAAGAQGVTFNAAHRSGYVMLKRYNPENSDRHFAAPSRSFWQELCSMPWSGAQWGLLERELENSYRSGTWYDEVGTQFNKRILERKEIGGSLGLDPTKKVAVIFPHLFWDATFFWGNDLFEDYKDWFCQVIKAAAANDGLNWVIKIHPAGVVKDARDGYSGESSEMIAIRETLGSLPDHIKLIPPDSKISTFSLFDIMDYCLTVRGTIGIEAAVFGAAVLTAGTGRYDGYGFTIDSQSREEYLDRLANLQSVPRPTDAQIELARRYAYGLFLVRPLHFESVRFRYLQDAAASLELELDLPAGVPMNTRRDIEILSAWLADAEAEDLVGAPERLAPDAAQAKFRGGRAG